MDKLPATQAILWFHRDLRLQDNPALAAAASTGSPLIPLFICDPEEEDPWAPGAASRWWLHHSLAALDESLRKQGSRLILRRGPTESALEEVLGQTHAKAVYWNRRYTPALLQRNEALQAWLERQGVTVRVFSGALLQEPWAIASKAGTPYRVFTPFWKTCLRQEAPQEALEAPATLPAPQRWPASLPLKALELEPKPNWAAGIKAAWKPGEAGAQERVKVFVAEAIFNYAEGRDRPDQEGASKLSPHLCFGEISPRQVFHAVQVAEMSSKKPGSLAGSEAFLRQLYWREFAYHVLHHEPQSVREPLRKSFNAFPWKSDPAKLKAWQQGQTGFPYIDAGMRQLWHTGWMHNRVRMAVASFLVKDLMIPWQEGARWFWDTLVDADLANNTFGWQWTAGCGADAAPYFRVFNPITQGQKFDPHGDYVRRWIPELAALPDKYLHRPWEASSPLLAKAGVVLGKDYPHPIVDHAQARRHALHAYDTIRVR